MRNLTIVLMINILTVSCIYKHEPSFDTIDYSCYKYPELWSMKISKDSKCYILSDNERKKTKSYFIFSINQNEIDTLSILINEISKQHLDTVYENGCDRCISYSFLIHTNKTVLKTSFDGQMMSDKNIVNVDKFAIQMNRIYKKYCSIIDTTFIFVSRPRVILPPPPSPRNKN